MMMMMMMMMMMNKTDIKKINNKKIGKNCICFFNVNIWPTQQFHHKSSFKFS